MSDAALERVWAAARGHVDDDGVPGVVALVAHAGEVHVGAFGALGRGRGPMTRDTLFRIASVTKPITAACTLALIGEGLLGLDEPVGELLPELADPRVLARPDGPLDETVPAARAITTRDLLTFTFGLGFTWEMVASATPWPLYRACEDDLHLATLGAPNPAIQPDADTWIERLGSLPLLAQPGERFLYNTSAAVLGVLCARAGGASFGEVLASRVLAPLGMHDTAFLAVDPGRLATGYRMVDGELVVADEADGVYARPPRFEDGGAGLVSSVDDLYRFATMLASGGSPVLSAGQVAEMTRDQLTPAQKVHSAFGPGWFEHQSWGYGICVHDDGSYGWDGGLGATLRVDPASDLVVIVLTQRMFDSPDPPQVHKDVRAAAYAAIR
ncbi:MAG: beta-lactamase family protein [Acidobacteriota bacterium]|nr:beta-lactamase family protein [Acidobacteriota bacterium]